MSSFGVRTVLAAAATLALLPLAGADGATPSAPKCFKGSAGCHHSIDQGWSVSGVVGNVTVTGTQPGKLTCADVADGAKAEVLKGTYTVQFSLDKKHSKLRVPTRNNAPQANAPLGLSIKEGRFSSETIRVVTPNGSGGCTEATKQCGAPVVSRSQTDALSIKTTTTGVVRVNLKGGYINSSFIDCSSDDSAKSLMVENPLDGSLVDESIALSRFRHRTTTVPVKRDRQLPVTEGSTSEVSVDASVTFARTFHACTYYGAKKNPSAIRCRDTRG